MQDTLVVICKNSAEAQAASINLPRSTDIKRYFVFLQEVENDSLSFLLPEDKKFMLPDIDIAYSNPLKVVIRAGLMYSFGYDVFFCDAGNLPTQDEIRQVRTHVKREGYGSSSRFWGISRDYVVLHGFDKIYGKAISQTDGDDDGDLMRAIKGERVGMDVISNHLDDFVSISAMQIHESMRQADHACRSVAQQILSLSQGESDMPHTILVSDLIQKEEFVALRSKIPPHGSVIVITANTQPFDVVPDQSFFLNQGANIHIFGYRSNN